MSFIQGLESGTRVAQGWMDTYNAARKRREEQELAARREGIMTEAPSGMYTEEQGEQLRAAGESGQYNIDYADGAYRVTPKADPSQTGLVAPTQRSRFLGQEYAASELTPERMQQLRDTALANTITDPLERQRYTQGALQSRAAEQQYKRTEAQMTDEQRARDTALRMESATTALNQLMSTGDFDVAKIYKLASDNKVDAAPLVRAAADRLNLTEATAKATTTSLIRRINQSATDPAKFNALLSEFADPDPTDDKVPQLRTTKAGVQVFYGDQPVSPVFRDREGVPALSQLAAHYRNELEGKPFETAIQLLGMEVKRAQVAESQADVALKGAQAGYYREGGRRAGLSTMQQKIEDFKVAYGREPTEQEKNIMFQLENRPGAGKEPWNMAFDVLKGTDAFKQAVERGNAAVIRELLVKNGVPPEAYFGAAAAPPGGGTFTPPPQAGETTTPAPALRPTAPSGPSPAATRALRDRPIGSFTSIDVVEAAAAAGNQAAIVELRRRQAAANRAAEVTQGLLRGLQ
jgi:hypothetical protein